jgi:uncharacterized protein YjbI with pentapeptide repeats
MSLLLVLIVWLGLSGNAHVWLAKLASMTSRILARPLPEVLAVVAILVVLALWLLPRWQASRSEGLTAGNRFDRENEARKTLAQIIGGVLVLAGLYSSLQTFSLQQQTLTLQQHTFDLQREGQVTDRFTKAIDQLGAVETGADGKPKINFEVRLGGIYALERIARDSPTDYWTIIEVLSTYVRNNSPATNHGGKTADGHTLRRTTTPPAEAGEQHMSADLQAILTVIGRRDRTHDPPDRRIDLSHADLSGANLAGTHFENAEFQEANLKANFLNAYLDEADLSYADLRGAHLEGASLFRALLVGAHLEGAFLSGNLQQASLDDAHLEKANLAGADLRGAYLRSACLNGAFLNGAHLEGAHLEGADLSGAYLQNAHLEGADLNGVYLDDARLEWADLSGAHGVSQSRLNDALGDKNTKLPQGNGLTRPASWH